MQHPDPQSSYFQRPEDRFSQNFATADQEARFQENEIKQKKLESRRINRYNRDMQRWNVDEAKLK